MRTTSNVLLVGLMAIFGGTTSAQTVDLGRGELPLHVPSGYDANTPAPLVVLLHGYGSSGEGQESYMQFGALVDTHGFLLVHPDGTQEATGRNARFWNASQACCNFGGSTIDDSKTDDHLHPHGRSTHGVPINVRRDKLSGKFLNVNQQPAVGWIEMEVDDWLNQQIEASRPTHAESGRVPR